MLIVDSKSIRNADTAKEKDYDAGKTSGIKLHIGVYAMGLPHAIYMTTANITDRSGAINMVEYCCDVKKIYTKIRAEVEVVKQNELHTFSVFPKR